MSVKLASAIACAERLINVRYAIRDLAVTAEQVAREGHKLLYLNIGDPLNYDFATPKHMIEAVNRAMHDGHNGYATSLGIPEAVKAIEHDAERRGFKDIQSIFICYGSGEAIDTCLTALVNPGDNVLTPSPEYPLYSAVLAKLDAVPNAYQLDESNGWQPDPEDIERRINERTKAIILINPNNPTGAVYSRETLMKIADVARRHNLMLFADEIYDRLIIDDDAKHYSIATLAPDVPCITFNGISKAYLAPGWRIGWGVATGPKAALADYLEGVHKLLRARLCASHPMMYAVKPALEGPQDHLVEVRKKLHSRRDLTAAWAAKTPRVSLTSPKGAFYAHPSLEIPDDDLSFVTDLLKQKHVLVVHGSGFGQKPGTKHIRIVFLPDEATLTRAYGKITEFMAERYR
jgi:alanine-synthesizing transaminase